MTKFMMSFYIALEAVFANKVRSLLTALGIIFGVAAVIAMLAIGSGAQKEILDQIKLVGVNNIVIKPVVEQSEEELEDVNKSNKQKVNFSTGLTLLDAESIKSQIPGISNISPEVLVETFIITNGIRRSAKLVGVNNDYFTVSSFELEKGRLFNNTHTSKGLSVCIIGGGIAARFFNQEEPIGKEIKVGKHWLKVVGVLKTKKITAKIIENLGIRDYNMDVYTPLKTALIRYKNRALITEAMIKRANHRNNNNEEKNVNNAPKNYHQIDRLVIQVDQTEKINATSEIITRMLQRRHFIMIDYEIEIPELLLQQQQRTKEVFKWVLIAIAAISLLVGGIGIMNIMLASVLERIKEIGLRLSLGAKKQDIILQFLLEAMLISISGGVIGIILGMVLSFLVSKIGEIPTVVSIPAIITSFSVAASIGLIFGILPARRAAIQDPITSLRHE